MIKKVLAAAFAAAALSAPAFAGSIGTIQGTSSTLITAGTRTVATTGSYASEEHTVGANTSGAGSSASAIWDPTSGPALTTTGVGGTSANTASATYSTNAVTGGSYTNNQAHSYTGNDMNTTTGVFFNY